MALAFANLGATNGTSANPDFLSTSGAASYSNSSWTPPTSGLIIVGIHNRHGTSPNVPTMSGNGLTWVEIATVTTATIHRLTLFAANASGSSAGATTIAFAGQSQVWCGAIFCHVTGIDLTGGAAAAFVQAPTNSYNGSNVSSFSVTLSAASHADNRPFAVFFKNNNAAFTPRTDWDELDDQNGTSTRSSQSQCRDDAFETTASVTTGTGAASWLGIAAELKAEGAGGNHDLTATGVDPGSPSVGTPALTQVHGLTGTGVDTGSPTVGSPALTQVHTLTGTDAATGSPTVGSPALTQVHILTTPGVATGSPTTESAALTQSHALAAAGVDTGVPTVGTPTLSAQGHDALAATGIDTGTPVVGLPALSQVHLLAIPGVATGGAVTGTPLIGQAHLLVAVNLETGSVAVGMPTLFAGDLPPASYVLLVAGESRRAVIEEEDRTIRVASDDRRVVAITGG